MRSGVQALLLAATKRLAFCEHPLATVHRGHPDVCTQCGATRLQDSGWALPMRLVSIRSMIEVSESETQTDMPPIDDKTLEDARRARIEGGYDE